MKNLNKTINNFQNSNILVIGDIMLDEYLFGDVSRINPEAPVPVVNIKRKEYRLGGAANVASNIISVGGNCSLIGMVGEDNMLDKLTKELLTKSINHYLIIDKEYSTIVKTRIIAKNQQVIRLDKEKQKKLENSKIGGILKYISENKFDTILISDYNKGTITKELIKEIKKLNIRIIADPKPKNIWLYKDIFAITPNLDEAKEISEKEKIEEIGKDIVKKLNTNLILTRGAEGVSLFRENKFRHNYFPAKTKEVFDVSGAGDTFVAIFSLGISSGLSLYDSVFLGNLAAGVVVKKQGTSTLTASEIADTLSSKITKIRKLKDLKEILSREKLKGKKIVFTNGCFDILHVGHIKLLNEAKTFGDILVLGINSDKSIKNIKGINRPINSEEDRVEVLSNIGSIDYLIIFGESTPLNVIKELEPDVLVKGSDYKKSEVVGADLIIKKGGDVKLIKLIDGKSTTDIINKGKNE